jgi:predicted MFS family arabinose efflux permease
VLPPAGPLRRYAVISLAGSIGTGLFLAAGTLFFTRVAGLPAGLVGLGLSLAGLAAMLAAIPLGSLGDKLGHRNVWVILTALQALTYACYPLVHSFLAFVAAVTVAAASQTGTRRSVVPTCRGPPARISESEPAPTTRRYSTPGSRSGPRAAEWRLRSEAGTPS